LITGVLFMTERTTEAKGLEEEIVGTIIDVESYYDENERQSYGVLMLKGEDNRLRSVLVPFDPYFYADIPDRLAEQLRESLLDHRGERIEVKDVEKVTRTFVGKPVTLYKIVCYHPSQVPALRNILGDYPVYEAKIPYIKRFMIDKDIQPFTKVRVTVKGRKADEVERISDITPKLKLAAFDIEVYNPQGVPDYRRDPIIMISYATDPSKEGTSSDKNGVITYREINLPFVKETADEKEMLNRFAHIVSQIDPDVLIGYNIEKFDFPYMYKRAKVKGITLSLGRSDDKDISPDLMVVRKGSSVTVRIPGRTYLDVYEAVRFLNTVGAARFTRLTLKSAYREFSGGGELESKDTVNRHDIWKAWEDDRSREDLARYNVEDSRAALYIGEKILPLEIELSKLARQTLPETARSTTGRLVESLLMYYSQLRGEIVPNIPDESTVRIRMANPIQGAYVKMPEPGIYKDIVVFDFRGLYPSIIISHNVDPATLNCECCDDEEAFVSPIGHKFCKKRRGLIPTVLEMLLDRRIEIKKRLKKLDPDTEEYARLYARSQAYKIIANSFYGYLAYPRSRWYCRECGASVTAWGRYYIKETIKKAEDMGFRVLYSDTDSVFLLLGDRSKEDALRFMEEVNKSLPGKMELELEGFYPRGVFVSKRGSENSEKGAKKKYALIDEQGRIKIRGFELVRRDWSEIAKRTQMNVLKAILKEGDPKKAVRIVKETVNKLRKGEVPIRDLVIYTQIQRNPKSYTVKSPELSAARKGIERGLDIKEGSVIGYVITRKGKSISDKAELAEYANDYDPNYYIDNQIIPAVYKILKELGFTKDELKGLGKQHTLNAFFTD